MRRPTRRVILWTVALAVIAGIATAAMRPKPIEVEAALAMRAPLRVTVNAEARTRVRARYVVTAPVTGQLERLRVRPGDMVRRGDVIARVAPLPLDAAALEAARARLTTAVSARRDADGRVRQTQESFALADRTLARYRELERVGGISRQQLEEAQLAATSRAEDVAAAKARALSAAGEVSAARAALTGQPGSGPATSVRVRAPADARVLLVPEESERIVAAGTPILELGRDSDLEIVADVLSEDAVKIPPDALVELAGWGGDMLLRGVVRRVEPAAQTHVSALGVEEQRVDVIVAPVGTPRTLGDAFRLDAHIVIWESRDVLTVPASAVFTMGGSARVFVVEGGRARERTVGVGHRSDAAAEIRSGLVPGDIVVLFPSDRVREGTRVRYHAPAFSPPAGGS